VSESKKELIEEHKRLVRILKEGTSKERLEEYERQLKELKKLVAGGEYEPENIKKSITTDPNYKGDHQAKVDGKWYKVKNVGVDKAKPVVTHQGENWYKLEGHPEGSVHQNRVEDYWRPGEDAPAGLAKSNYGPKGAGLYDPTVNQKRKARNVETVEGLGQNKNVKEYTSAKQGTSKEWAATQAKKDLAVNKKQKVKTMADLSPEEKAEIEAKYNTKINTIKKSLEKLKETLLKAQEPKPEPKMDAQRIMHEIRTRQPTDAEINFLLSQQCTNGQEGQAEAEARAAEERYRRMCEED
jgi:hypothetical protein